MADATSLPPDPAVLETEMLGRIVSRLVAGIAALASSPTSDSAAWGGVKVSVNLTRVDSGRRPSYRVSVDAEPGRGVGPEDDSVAAFVSRIFAGVERAAILPEQVTNVFLATATKQEAACRTYDWRGSPFAHRMDVWDPRDPAPTPETPEPPTSTPRAEDARRLMERARRDTRPKSHAGLLPSHAFTAVRFAWTPTLGVLVLDPAPRRTSASALSHAPNSVVLDEIVDAIRRQVECLPENARVDVAAADETEPPPNRRDAKRFCFSSTRHSSPTAMTPERRPPTVTTRGVASGAGPMRGWSATTTVRLERVDHDASNDDAARDVGGGSVSRARRASRTTRVYFFENGALLTADAALARGDMDWLCVSSASSWDTGNVPRVFRRGVRERADGDSLVSLAFDSDPPAAADGAAPAPRAFAKHAYRVAELVVHVARDEAFLRAEAPRSERSTSTTSSPTRNASSGEDGETLPSGSFFFHPSTLVPENGRDPRHRPGEAERARARLVRAALDAAIWRAKRLDAVTFASASERAAAAAAATVADAAVAALRRGERAGAPFAVSAARALETVVGADWEAEYRDAMLATAFEDAKYKSYT